jgi:acyl-CoA hydrolase
MTGPVILSAHAAAERIRRRDTLAVPLGPGQPPAFLHALGKRDDFEALVVFSGLLVDAFQLFTHPGVRLLSGFLGPVERALVAQGRDVEFLPADFRRFAPALAKVRPRVMATAVAGRDPDGPFSLSLHAGATVAGLRECGRDPDRLLIAEVNPNLPYTHGLPPDHPHALSREEVDILVFAESSVIELPDESPSPLHERIAAHARPFIPETATLQTGIGGIAGAIVRSLADLEGGRYGIHTEMFTDGLMHLHLSGRVTNQKGVYDGISVATFAAGSRALYDWLDGNEDVRFLPVHLTNDPSLIARNRDMRSLNGALAIDLYGQVAADTLGGHQHSGIGGHEDFAAGAGLPAEGRSLICLPSTATSGGERVSRIVSQLDPGTLVTTPRHQLDVVVTEHGAVDLMGLGVEARAKALLSVADPDFRDGLLAPDGWPDLARRDGVGHPPLRSSPSMWRISTKRARPLFVSMPTSSSPRMTSSRPPGARPSFSKASVRGRSGATRIESSSGRMRSFTVVVARFSAASSLRSATEINPRVRPSCTTG